MAAMCLYPNDWWLCRVLNRDSEELVALTHCYCGGQILLEEILCVLSF